MDYFMKYSNGCASLTKEEAEGVFRVSAEDSVNAEYAILSKFCARRRLSLNYCALTRTGSIGGYEYNGYTKLAFTRKALKTWFDFPSGEVLSCVRIRT